MQKKNLVIFKQNKMLQSNSRYIKKKLRNFVESMCFQGKIKLEEL